MDLYYKFQAEVSLLSRRWRARVNERLETIGLTQARSYILFWLSQSPEGLNQRELAERAGIESPTLVRQIDALEQQGLVRRTPVLGDRRVNLIQLTEAARPLLDQIHAVFLEHNQSILGDLDPAKMQACAEMLAEIRARLDVAGEVRERTDALAANLEAA